MNEHPKWSDLPPLEEPRAVPVALRWGAPDWLTVDPPYRNVYRRDNRPSGAELADRAIHQADKHAHPEWMEMAEQCVRYCAQFLGTFTNDDVWAEIEGRCAQIKAGGGVAPWTHEPRALGSINRRLARQGLIAKTGEYVKSTRRSNHAQAIPVWKKA